ncbi:glutathione peroxidase [Seonamhaeicola sp.]|uniref:glutathione peroxidase n=1 Tax=Seonamhaeicola sp. TaxID=1912245 RepID=UPI0026321F0D|nr:glutathione peroxidase [Seonamhaeicola sp.]
MNILKTLFNVFGTHTADTKLQTESLYDISINALNGKPIPMSQFKGKYLLFVNVASKCGFTPQYGKLQQLHEQYQDKLQIIGVPCNQFGGQEPGDAPAISSFCKTNYGVTFLITEKTDVKGRHQHPLYSWLTQKSKNGTKNSSVKWNFQKYLVDTNGNLIDYFFSSTDPLSSKITNYLK